MEGSQPARIDGGYYEIVQPQRGQDSEEAEAECDVSKTFGMPCPASGVPSSVHADHHSQEIVAHHHAFSYLIAAIRKMQR